MIFLIQFDQKKGRLTRVESFGDLERDQANIKRLEVEVKLLREKIDNEVVLLEANSLDALKRTHRRYFDAIEQWPQDFQVSFPDP